VGRKREKVGTTGGGEGGVGRKGREGPDPIYPKDSTSRVVAVRGKTAVESLKKGRRGVGAGTTTKNHSTQGGRANRGEETWVGGQSRRR